MQTSHPSIGPQSPSLATERLADGRVRLAPRGELDLSIAGELKRRLILELDRSPSVLLDLAEVTFIDSTVLGTIVAAQRHTEAGNGRLQIGPSLHPQPTRLFWLTGVLSDIMVQPSQDERQHAPYGYPSPSSPSSDSMSRRPAA